MEFQKGNIEGVQVKPIRKFTDERGWLAEVFRHDEIETEFHPVMAYVSITNPGVLRGPHEHVDQADYFAWIGPGEFKVTLWDNRKTSPSFGNRMELFMGANNPGTIVVPKGVVHCYSCISVEPGWVFNAPNQLFAGQGKKHPIDEIRHEEDPQNPFVVDEKSRRVHLR